MRLSTSTIPIMIMFAACVPATADRTDDPGVIPPDQMQPPQMQAELAELTVDPPKTSVDVGSEINFTVRGRDRDGQAIELANTDVTWTSSNDALLAPVTDALGRFRGIAPGSVEVHATAGMVGGVATVEVIAVAPVPATLRLSQMQLSVPNGASADVTAELTWSDGTHEDVTNEAVWSSSSPAILTVARGHVTRVGRGDTSIAATHLGLTTSAEVIDGTPPCGYPAGPTSFRVGATMPLVSWSNAYRPDATQFNFTIEDVYCAAEYDTKTIIVFVVGAGWCPACTQYAQDLNQDAEAVEAAGTVIVYVEAQDANYQPANSAYANQHMTRLIGTGPGVRVGDADTLPTASMFLDSPLTTQFPTVLVVRKSDMKIIIDQAEWSNMLPFAQIARHSEDDWSHPNRPPAVSNCEPNDEEMGEPNNTTAEATPIQGGSFNAGICNAQPDFYQISHPGNWTLDLTFSHAIGDIDVQAWNPQTNGPLTSGGREVGSTSGDDDESFSHSGPTLVRVIGYQGASAPYRLTLTTN